MGKKHFLQGLFFLLVACSKPDPGPVYTDANQRAAIALFEGIYESDDGAVTTTLCQSDEVPIDICQSAFFIRREGQDVNDTQSGGAGCGGCPYNEVTTGLRAEVIRGGDTTRFEGMLSLAVEDTHEPAALDLPFSLDFATSLDEPHDYVDAKFVVNEDRSVTLTENGEAVSLHRVGDADCVHRPIE